MLGTAPSTQELLASLLSSYQQEQDLEVEFYQVPRVLRVISEFTISSYPRDTDQTQNRITLSVVTLAMLTSSPSISPIPISTNTIPLVTSWASCLALLGSLLLLRQVLTPYLAVFTFNCKNGRTQLRYTHTYF